MGGVARDTRGIAPGWNGKTPPSENRELSGEVNEESAGKARSKPCSLPPRLKIRYLPIPPLPARSQRRAAYRAKTGLLLSHSATADQENIIPSMKRIENSSDGSENRRS
jgi:hypothetical protein